MQNKLLTALLVASVAAASSALAQDTTVVTPSSPAPTVETPSSAASAQSAPAAAVAQTAPTPNQVIYSPRLPSASELTSVAAAQGLSVEQINQTATQVTVIYRQANGQTNTVAYQLLPTPGAPATTTVAAPTTVVTPAPTVVYQQAPQVIYYDTYDYYRPRYYYRPPVSVHLGFGYSSHRWGGHHHRHRHHW